MILNTLNCGNDWALYKFPFISENKDQIIAELNLAHKNFKNRFTGVDSSLTSRDQITLGDLPSLFEESRDHQFLENEMKTNSNLSGYSFYNVFALTSPSPFFYNIYKTLRNIIRLHVGDERPVWFQSWLNFHNPNSVLDWHNHAWDYHGYISIDPMNTTTKFKNNLGEIVYEIDNYPGQIYFGPGGRMHKVFVNEDFGDKPRLTIGYDITFMPTPPDDQFSLLPLL